MYNAHILSNITKFEMKTFNTQIGRRTAQMGDAFARVNWDIDPSWVSVGEGW